ncbi:MAG: MFS transporter [Alphaproteobacteria bacterium]|nr:MFS transporter [Alphaproteobacteria bacterium]
MPDYPADQPAPSESRPPSWQGGALVVLLGTILGMNQLKISPVVGELISGGYREHEVAWLMSVYAFGGIGTALYLLFAPTGPGGSFNRVAAAVLLLTGAGLIGGLWPAPSFALLFCLRLAESVGFTALAVYAPAHLASVADPRRAGILMGLWAMWMPLGQLVLFVLAASGLALRAPLWTTVAALTLVVGALFLRGLGAALRSPSVRMARRGPLPALGPAAFAAVLYMVFSIVFAGLITWIPYVMRTDHGVGAREIALVMSGFALCTIAGTWIAPRLIPRLNVFRVVMGSFAALGGLILLLATGPGVVLAVVIGTPLWVAAGMAVTAVISLPIWIAIDMGNAYNYACLQVGRWVGTLIGPLVLAAAIAHTGGWAGGLVAIAAAALGVVPAAAWAAGRFRRRTA